MFRALPVMHLQPSRRVSTPATRHGILNSTVCGGLQAEEFVDLGHRGEGSEGATYYVCIWKDPEENKLGVKRNAKSLGRVVGPLRGPAGRFRCVGGVRLGRLFLSL